jgi:hypothetical protein
MPRTRARAVEKMTMIWSHPRIELTSMNSAALTAEVAARQRKQARMMSTTRESRFKELFLGVPVDKNSFRVR